VTRAKDAVLFREEFSYEAVYEIPFFGRLHGNIMVLARSRIWRRAIDQPTSKWSWFTMSADGEVS
jgi:hypothetical protein